MKNIIVYLAIFTLLIVTSDINAQQHMRAKDSPEHSKMIKELNLTDQQKDELAKLRSEHQKSTIDLRANIQKIRVEIKDELREKNLNENKILSLTKKISDLQAQLKESAVKMWLDSYKLLDDKQREIWKEHAPMLMENMNMIKGKMGERKMFKHMNKEGNDF